MKKIMSLLIVSIALSTYSYAQTSTIEKAKKQLDVNLKTLQELDKILAEEYVQKTTALDAVNGATFLMNGCMVLSSYGDESLQKLCKEYEVKINNFFAGSTWQFGKHNPNGQSNITVVTSNGQKGNGTYTGWQGSGTVKINGIMEGIDMEPYIYQNKKNKNEFLMIFSISNGMGCVLEITKK